jgi:hypothetical protein
MFKYLLSTLFFFLAISYSQADVKIDKKHWVKNRSPGYCTWCGLDTLARHHEIKPLIGIVDHRVKNKLPSGGTNYEVIKALDQAKVDYTLNTVSNYKLLTDVCDDGIGAVVSMFHYPTYGDYHSVTLVDITPTRVRFIDSNDLREEMTYPRSNFESKWDGISIIVRPTKHNKRLPDPVNVTPAKPVPVTRMNRANLLNVFRHTMTEEEARRLQKILTGEKRY